MWFAVIAAVVLGGVIYYYFFTSGQSVWKKHGIKEIDPSAAMSTLDLFLWRKGLVDKDDYIYRKLGNDKFCGFMEMGKPMMFVKDLDLAKKLFIKDVDYFVDRRQFFQDQDQDASLKRMLIALQGDEWKGVRSAISPTFTTGKIRRMMSYFNSVGQEWVDDFGSKAKQSGTGAVLIDVADSVNHYVLDVIASAVFGMNAGSIKNPKSRFAMLAGRMAGVNMKLMIKFAVIFMFPKVFKLLKLKLFDQEALDFFKSILDQGLKARMNGEIKRDDFLQLLVEAKKGELKGAGSDELSAFEKDAQMGDTDKKQHLLTEEVMNAQSFSFFFAGYTTTSTFLSFAVYALAAHQDVQEKLRKDVGRIVKENGSFDYDTLGQLAYLEMFVCEVFRMFPGAIRLERLCVKDYKDPETGLFVPKGALVTISVNSVHHDSQYYDSPEKFDPELHFSAEKKAGRSPYVYLPFGMGPRNCIGMRFALTQSKVAIAHLVHNFIIEPTPKTPLPMRGKPAAFTFIPPKDLEVKLTPVRT